MLRFALLTWLLVALFSLRWFGIWYMSRPNYTVTPPRCHGDVKSSTYHGCCLEHNSNCWRSDRHAVPRTTRSVEDGIWICLEALAWPILIWPLLAIWVTPESKAELQERVKQAEDEIKRLEQETQT